MNMLISWLRALLAQDKESDSVSLRQAPIDAARQSSNPAAAASSVFSPLPLRIPVLLVHYFPLNQSGEVDSTITGDIGGPLEQIRAHTERTTHYVIGALESGSAYHAYKDPSAKPSLHYEIAGSIEFYEPLPTLWKVGHRVPMTDYNAIMAKVDIRAWVAERGVKEVWIWGYHGGVIDLWESNMASRWGDISNSDRDPHDLPVLDKSYTVYHYNYQRDVSEAVEDHIHQIEAVLRHVDPHLFWERFVGRPGEGRCGWAHYPPNGVRDYDWRNPAQVLTDIEDWRPDGKGEKRLINCERWNGDSLQWFIYWMQNIPGADNQLSHDGRPLTNWWHFIADWDRMMEARIGLVDA